MTIFKFLRIAFLFLSFAILVVGGYLFYSLDSTLSQGCERIAQIAKDKKAVAYLDNWTTENVIDKGYYFVSGMHGNIAASSTNGSTKTLPLPDESESRIEWSFFRFGLEKIGGDFNTPITSDNVGEIRFGRGRNNIILLKNGQILESYRGHDVASGHLLKINDSLYAYCADARF